MRAGTHHSIGPQRRDGQGWWCFPWGLAAVLALGLALASPSPVQAKTFHCGAGEVQCLIDAINEANANGHKNTIRLKAGTYTLTAVDNTDNTGLGANGLPSITSTLTIRGAGAQTTIIERDPRLFFQGPGFRILHVAAAGVLTLEGVMISGGQESLGSGIFNDGGRVSIHTSTITANYADSLGGGIYNFRGVVTVTNSTIVGNVVGPGYGGGLENDRGEVTITHSSIADNDAELAGGIDNFFGTVTITNSTIAGNSAEAWGGIFNSGTMTIINSTIAQNFTFLGGGGAIENYGTATIINSTIAHNRADGGSGGGIENVRGTIELHNTILANNTAEIVGWPTPGPDCFGSVTSLGHNLIGDPTDCTITLQSSDLKGDPGLDAFTDDGTPGNGHFPLLPTSQAIDAGNDAVCPQRDQLGRPRRNIPRVGTSRCDIGAVEFVPGPRVVNDLVTFVPLPATFETTLDPRGCPAGFVGTFRFRALLTPQPSSPPLTDLVVVVTRLSNGNLLRNAQGQPEGEGARLRVPRREGFADGLLSPGETVAVPMEICLTAIAPFTLLVDVHGAGVFDDGRQGEAPENVAVLQ